MFLAAAQTLKLEEALKMLNNHKTIAKLAEGVGFEPTVALRLLLISRGIFIFFLFTENFYQVKST